MVAPEQKLSDLDARALMPSNDKWRTAIRTQFLVADPTLFSGIAPRFRLLVYSKPDVDTLRQGAPFYPPRVEYLFSSLDGMKHFVLWSASWTGGRFLVTCASADRPCEVTVISNWIS